MSTTISYKGDTLTTVDNQTKTLETAGTWLEDDLTVTDVSSNVVIVDSPDAAGGTVREITVTGNPVMLQGSIVVEASDNQRTVEPDTGYAGFESVVVPPTGYSFDQISSNNYGDVGTMTLNTAFVKPYTFIGCTGITSVYAPNTTHFKARASQTTGDGMYVFAYCTNLVSIYFPLLTQPGSGGYQFAYCTKLTTAYHPLGFIGQHMFHGCTALKVFANQATGTMNGNCFYGCTALETIDLKTNKLNSNEFNGCTKLNTIVLRNASVVTLGSTNNFTNTPFASGKAGGTIYIPKSLYDCLGTGTTDYKAATNWSTIDGYGTITWAQIEGSIYETQYADGTPISGIGANLLTNSESFNPSVAPYTNSTAIIHTDTYLDGTVPAYTCEGNKYVQIDLPSLQDGGLYTISFDVIRNGDAKVYITIGGVVYDLGTAGGSEWRRFSQPFSYSSTNTTYVRINVHNADQTLTTGTYRAGFRHFKLETGLSSTEYVVPSS